uniref:Uncharacterized protein n=1 Tax=Ixodes ricinus TaxID=34613 RepID=A0A6B0UTT4_IXORI
MLSRNSINALLLFTAVGMHRLDPSLVTGVFATWQVRVRSAFRTTEYLIHGASSSTMCTKRRRALPSTACQNVEHCLLLTWSARSFKSRILSASSRDSLIALWMSSESLLVCLGRFCLQLGSFSLIILSASSSLVDMSISGCM